MPSLSAKKQDAILAISITNVCFIKLWVFLFASPQSSLNIKIVPDAKYIVALICNVIVVSLVGWWLGQLIRKTHNKVVITVAKLSLLLILLIPLNYLRTEIISLSDIILFLNRCVPLGRFVWIAVGGIAIATGLLLWLDKLMRGVKYAFLAISPLVLINFAHAGYTAISAGKGDSVAEKMVAAPLPVREGAPRILWIVFDELDYARTFEYRDSSVNLPNIDKMRAQSLHATHAYSPANSTPTSISSLLTGEIIGKMTPVGSSEIRLAQSEKGGKEILLSKSNIFSKARALGFNSGIVGWHLAYGRLVADSTIRCSWYGSDSYGVNRKLSFGEAIANQIQNLSPVQLMQNHITRYAEMMQDVKAMIADQRIGLMYVHLPVPHRPFIYDRFRKKFRLGNYALSGYLDNLTLMDQSLGEIWQAMEKYGQWENTTVIVSSDHHWRDSEKYDGNSDQRVPFLVKLSGQKNAIVFDHPFNTVVTADLILSVLRGEIYAPSEFTYWLGKSCIGADCCIGAD